MNVGKVLERLTANKITITVIGGDIHYQQPQGQVDRVLLEATLRKHKASLLALAAELEKLYSEWVPIIDVLFQEAAFRSDAAAIEDAMVTACVTLNKAAMTMAVERGRVTLAASAQR